MGNAGVGGRHILAAHDPNQTFAARIAPPHSGHWVSACCRKNANI